MENKTTKFILKTILLFPIGFGFWALINGFDLNNWVVPVIAGFVGSFGIVFWQLFDYEKYNEIEYVDFLESRHSIMVENSNENWNKINELIKNPFAKLKILDRTENTLKIQIERKFLDSILTVNKTQNYIVMEIEKNILGFLPDNAENYRTLKKLAKGLKTSNNQINKTLLDRNRA
ncbi:hypothetical protein BFP77_01535 [Maribacter sp. 4U21]|uniref:hypothetical protein n=1 Tax=Maribacter sp. 4U21 TaxID=1889779 RepID=UPI000C14C053|nr:hypothetical protein [Maribacter sp. 4U21]PIB31284.1 hypothetical protein BFP77_01535 [Maribacter sp. 4U21]